jgi:hypothetical protein
LTATYGQVIPSLAFYHIPAHSMLQYQEGSFDPLTTPGINGEKVVSQGSMDTKYTGQDRQFMHALLHTPGLIATFSGHDHENDWYESTNQRLTRSLIKLQQVLQMGRSDHRSKSNWKWNQYVLRPAYWIWRIQRCHPWWTPDFPGPNDYGR